MVSRLVDVFLTGPLQVYMGTRVRDVMLLRTFMVVTGVLTIAYNLHNYLYLEQGVIRNQLGALTHPVHGKRQWHRAYNLVVMYPVFYYVYVHYPSNVSFPFLINIILGFAYNLYNFVKILS